MININHFIIKIIYLLNPLCTRGHDCIQKGVLNARKRQAKAIKLQIKPAVNTSCFPSRLDPAILLYAISTCINVSPIYSGMINNSLNQVTQVQ